ncbi:MAG: hypothetical protein IH600_05490 [Bacteroidetes bacterium]|nr:hypothetical protein [Bacteroidota bacterium]
MSEHPSDNLIDLLDELRSMIGSKRNGDAVKRLRALHKKHPSSLETHALLMHALASGEILDEKSSEELHSLLESAPEETEALLRFCELLIDEGEPRPVEALLDIRWKEILWKAVDVVETETAATAVLEMDTVIRATTVMAEAFMASGRGSSALDVVDEARDAIPLPEFDTLRSRLRAAFDPNDESPMAELHAVRRKMMDRYLMECGMGAFEDTEEAKGFFEAFQVSWNLAMDKKPLPYAMMPDDDKTEFLENIYDGIIDVMDGGETDERRDEDFDLGEITAEERETVAHFMQRSAELFAHPLFESSSLLRPFAVFIPNIMVRLGIPLESIDDFLEGKTDSETLTDVQDTMSVIGHLVAMRIAGSEAHYRKAFANLYDLICEYLEGEKVMENIDELCDDLDQLLSHVGIPTVRFMPGGAAQTSGSGRPQTNKKHFGKKGKKKPKRRK